MRWALKHSLVLTLSVLLCSAQAHLPLSQSSSCGAVILQGFTFGPRDLSTHRLLKSKSGHLSQHVYFLLILFTGMLKSDFRARSSKLQFCFSPLDGRSANSIQIRLSQMHQKRTFCLERIKYSHSSLLFTLTAEMLQNAS